MARPSVEFSPVAAAEVLSARAWYGEHDPHLADAFEAELTRMVELIAELPRAWPTYAHGTRRALLQRFPLALVYRLKRDRIEVVALAHLRRRPAYWRFPK